MSDEPISAVPNEPGTVVETVVGDPQTVTTADETADAVPATETPEPLDPQYVSRAQMFNMTEEDLRAVPRETVERMIAGADKAMIEAFRREQPAANAAAPVTTAPTDAPADFEFDAFDVNFDPDEEIADSVVNAMKAMQEHSAKQFDKLHKHYESKFQTSEQFVSNVQKQQDYAILDRYIDQLGKEWSGVFGKGATLDMDSRSQECLEREKLRMAAIDAMEINRRHTGQALTASQALPRALNSMFYKKAAEIELNKAAAKRKELQDAAAVRPKSGEPGLPVGSIRSRARELAASMRQ